MQRENTQYPLVTIITPAYNLAPYLPETIESVLNQDYPNIEYIVLDDGSKDNTCEVLARYTGRIHWETHENMGEARTVNKGWKMAKGDYVVVVNADDPIYPSMISKLVRYMEDHPDVLVLYPDWHGIDEKSNVLFYNRTWDYDYAKMLSQAGCVPGPGTMIRRRALELEGERNTNYRYVTDLEFWLRMGLHGPFARYPEALATHRTHPDSSGVVFKPAVGKEIIHMMAKFFENPNLPPHIRALYKPATASAYFEAGCRVAEYPERRRLYLKSFFLHPRSWLDDDHRRAHWRFLVYPFFLYKLRYVILNPVKFLRHKLGIDPQPTS